MGRFFFNGRTFAGVGRSFGVRRALVELLLRLFGADFAHRLRHDAGAAREESIESKKKRKEKNVTRSSALIPLCPDGQFAGKVFDELPEKKTNKAQPS